MGHYHGRVPLWETWFIKWALNELIDYFNLLSQLPPPWMQFFSDRCQTWWGCALGQDLGRVHSWDMWLVKWALDELVNYFDLLSQWPLQFFSDCGQTWWWHTLGQDLRRVRSWETWLVKWVLNELINYGDLLSLLPLSRVQFFSDHGQTWWGRTLGQDLVRLSSWETWLIRGPLNELINYFDLLSPLLFLQVQFSDRSQIWWVHILGQDLRRVPSWETWLVKWALNELIILIC